MQTIVLAPQKVLEEGALDQLVAELEQLGFNVEIKPYENPFVGGRSGVSWWETIYMHLPAIEHVAEHAAEHLAEAVAVATAKDIAKERLKKVGGAFVTWAKSRGLRRGKNPTQPKFLRIFEEPDGKTVIREITLLDANGEPEIKDRGDEHDPE